MADIINLISSRGGSFIAAFLFVAMYNTDFFSIRKPFFSFCCKFGTDLLLLQLFPCKCFLCASTRFANKCKCKSSSFASSKSLLVGFSTRVEILCWHIGRGGHYFPSFMQAKQFLQFLRNCLLSSKMLWLFVLVRAGSKRKKLEIEKSA